jgi:hypothetical protein
MDLDQLFSRAWVTECWTQLEKWCESETKDGDGGVRRVLTGDCVSG